MANSATFNSTEGIIEVVVDGPQTKESIGDLTKEVAKAASEASLTLEEIRTLADASGMGHLDIESEAAAVRGFKVVSFDRLAIVVGNDQMRAMLETLAKLSGKASLVQFFDDQQHARSWLK